LNASSLHGMKLKLPMESTYQEKVDIAVDVQMEDKTYTLKNNDIAICEHLVNAFPEKKHSNRFALGIFTCFSLHDDNRQND